MLTYSTIVEKDGKTALFAETEFQRKVSQIADLNGVLARIGNYLKAYAFPVELPWITAIVTAGSPGLRGIMEKSVDAEMERLKLPAYMRNTYQAGAVQSLTPEDWAGADRLHADCRTFADGLPVDASDIIINGDGLPAVDTQVVTERLRPFYVRELTEEEKANASKLVELSREIRALELQGVNALEIIFGLYRTDDTPAPLSLFSAFVSRYHSPGKLSGAVVVSKEEYMARE